MSAARRGERPPAAARPTRADRALVALLAGVSLALGGCAAGGGAPTLDDLKGVAGSVLGGEGGAGTGALTDADIVEGLKQALATGSSAVVAQLGRPDGFEGDPRIRIPLPPALQKAKDLASRVGLADRFETLEVQLNRAAEEATPKAKALFLGAIRTMSIDDARGILQGPDDAATTYFRTRTGDELEGEMRPIVADALGQVGALATFESLASRYDAIPGLPSLDADLAGYVVERATDGIFLYVAEEEKSIRENPLERTTEILQRVFGSR